MKYRKHIYYYLFLVSLSLFSSCYSRSVEKSDASNTPRKSKQAHVVFRTEPEVVPFLETREDGGNCWDKFSVILEEKGGIGATLVDWYQKQYNYRGELERTFVEETARFADKEWQGCDKHDLHIEPHAKICQWPGFECAENNTKGWYQEIHMWFVDDNENTFKIVGRIIYAPKN